MWLIILLCVQINLISVLLLLFLICNADYDLEFTEEGTSDYVQLWGMPDLKQFTVSFRMKTKKANPGTPFSYGSSAEYNDLLIFNYANFYLYIGGEYR